MSLRILREDCTYTSCYCEENVWHICNYVKENHPMILHECYAVFISNEKQTIPLWSQKHSDNEQGLVIWDYHVIFIHHTNKQCGYVYDLDTKLAFPCSFDEYKTKALGSDESLQTQFQRHFRVIPAALFLAIFASDRTHMIKDGKWLKPPPTYPPIFNATSQNNLYAFINMINNSDQEVPGQRAKCNATHIAYIADEKMSEFHVRCRKCRSKLIVPDEKDCITTCHGSDSPSDVGNVQCLIDKSILYIKDEQLPKWLETLIQNSSWTKGKIVCPSCDARLGTFDFLSGQKCQCQHYVLPPVRLTSSRVDMLKS